MKYSVDGKHLHQRLKDLGKLGRDENGVLSRLEANPGEKEGRDQVVAWMKELDLKVAIDKIGNIFGIWETEENKDQAPVMVGSHIDSVMNAGIYDGCYGVLGGIEVIRTLKEGGYKSPRPLVVGAFTNEEGVRYQPDMLGSLVYVGGLDLDEALNTVGIDGSKLGEELEKIGYAGPEEPGFIKPYAYVELHVEQGPVLDHEGYTIGAVDSVQGISWQKITIEGEANHAGTTPTRLRVDAGLAAAKVNTFLRERADKSNHTTVATVGSIEFQPNLVNVIPSKARFTVDIRNSNLEKFLEEGKALKLYLKELEDSDMVKISTESLAQFDPVPFDEDVILRVEKAAENRGLKYRRITSGAGHDAQMLARICPTAMIFAPSIKGISHNPNETTDEKDLAAGANVLLDVVMDLAESN